MRWYRGRAPCRPPRAGRAPEQEVGQLVEPRSGAAGDPDDLACMRVDRDVGDHIPGQSPDRRDDTSHRDSLTATGACGRWWSATDQFDQIGSRQHARRCPSRWCNRRAAHRDPVGDPAHLVQVVRHQHHGGTVHDELAEVHAELLLDGLVDLGERLVEDEQLPGAAQVFDRPNDGEADTFRWTEVADEGTRVHVEAVAGQQRLDRVAVRRDARPAAPIASPSARKR